MPDPVQDSNARMGIQCVTITETSTTTFCSKILIPFIQKKKEKQKVSVLIAVVQDSNPGRSDTSPVH